MSRKKQRVLSLCCGAVTFALHFYVIPQFFMRGLHDVIWGALMLLLPVIPAVMLLYPPGRCAPRSVFWALLAECAGALVFCKPVGAFLGYRLDSLAWDLFDFIAYFMFAWGWAVAAALVQFIVLLALSKTERS